MDTFITWSSNVDSRIRIATTANKPEEVRRLTQNVERANRVMESWLLVSGGKLIGYENNIGMANVGADHLGELPELKEQYESALDGAKCSMGVATDLHQARVAIDVAKHRGGKIVFYTPDVSDEAQQIEAEEVSESSLDDDELNAIEEPMDKAQPGYWTVQDWVKIPKQGNPEREAWDKDYRSRQVEFFGVHPTRKPIEIPLEHLEPSHIVSTDPAKTKLYTRMYRAGDAPPPIVAHKVGAKLWQILDGNRRLEAAKAAGQKSIQVLPPMPVKTKVKKSEEEYEPLEKMAVIHDDPKNPKMVWRLQLKGAKQGEASPGPYDVGGGGYSKPKMERWDRYQRYLSSAALDEVDNNPVPEQDFTRPDYSAWLKNWKQARFGFETEQDAKDWFGDDLGGFGGEMGEDYELAQVPASHIRRSKSGRQVWFIPAKKSLEKMAPPITRPVTKMPFNQVSKYAYNALERDTLHEDREIAARADEAMDRFMAGKMPREEMNNWAARHLDYLSLTQKSEAPLAKFNAQQNEAGEATQIAQGQMSPSAAQPSPLPQRGASALPSASMGQPSPQEGQPQGQPPPQGEQGGDIKSAIVGVLKDFRKEMPVYEAMKKENPEAYEAVMGLVEAMLAMAKKLIGEPVQKSELAKTSMEHRLVSLYQRRPDLYKKLKERFGDEGAKRIIDIVASKIEKEPHEGSPETSGKLSKDAIEESLEHPELVQDFGLDVARRIAADHKKLGKSADKWWKNEGEGTVSPLEMEKADLAADQFKKVGGQLGGNVGGQFKDAKGDKWYLKFHQTSDHAKNEMLAGHLYRAAGHRALELHPMQHSSGAIGTASKWIPLEDMDETNPEHLGHLKRSFGVHAWLANWDAVLGGNMALHEGKPLTVDTGGALEYRAMGEPKGGLFGGHVGEFDTLRSPDINWQAANIFGEMTPQEIAQSVGDVAGIQDKTIDDLVMQHGPGDENRRKQLAKKLKARRDNLVYQAEQETGLPIRKPTDLNKNVLLPVGSQSNDGDHRDIPGHSVKVVHGDGQTSFVRVGAGQVRSNDAGHTISSRIGAMGDHHIKSGEEDANPVEGEARSIGQPQG